MLIAYNIFQMTIFNFSTHLFAEKEQVKIRYSLLVLPTSL